MTKTGEAIGIDQSDKLRAERDEWKAEAVHLESVLAKVRAELLDRASIAAERKGASGDRREREYYSGQSNAFEMAALLIPLSGEAAGELGDSQKGGE